MEFPTPPPIPTWVMPSMPPLPSGKNSQSSTTYVYVEAKAEGGKTQVEVVGPDGKEIKLEATGKIEYKNEWINPTVPVETTATPTGQVKGETDIDVPRWVGIVENWLSNIRRRFFSRLGGR